MNWLAEVVTLELTVSDLRTFDDEASCMDPIVEIGLRRAARRVQNERRYRAYREAMFNFEQAEKLRRGRGRIAGSIPENAERHARYAEAFRELGTAKAVGQRLNVGGSAASKWFLTFGAAHGLVKVGRRVVDGRTP